MYEDSQRDMDNQTIDFSIYQDPLTKDKMMIGLYETFEEMDEPKPDFLAEMIKERSMTILPKLKKAAVKEFRKQKEEIFSTTDESEIMNRLLNLVHQEYRYSLTYDEKDILGCSLEYHEMTDPNYEWYELAVADELMTKNKEMK